MGVLNINTAINTGLDFIAQFQLRSAGNENSSNSKLPSLEEKADQYHALKEEFPTKATNLKQQIFTSLSGASPLDERKLAELRANLEKFYHPDAVAARTDCGIDDNHGTGHSFVTLAAHNGHLAPLKDMAKLGVDVKKQNNQKWTAVVEAAAQGHVHVLKFLHEQNVDLKAADGNQNTAALAAVRGNHLNVIKFLHAHNINLHEATPERQSAISLAQELDHSDIVQFMDSAYKNSPYQAGLKALEI